jgi:hypothetical protein
MVKLEKPEAKVMRFRIAAFMCFILATTVSLFAQARTITNADLEKYRQVRLNAERDYRENYEKLGMPSPAELERRREQSRIETEQLSERLRALQFERERLEMEREQLELQRRQLAAAYSQPILEPQGYGSTFLGVFGGGSRFRGRGRYQQPYYAAGGQVWYTGSQTRSRPMFARPRTPRR